MNLGVSTIADAGLEGGPLDRWFQPVRIDEEQNGMLLNGKETLDLYFQRRARTLTNI